MAARKSKVRALILRVAAIAGVGLFSSGCLTYKWNAVLVDNVAKSSDPTAGNPKNELPTYLHVTYSPGNPNEFLFLNKSKESIAVSYKDSVAEIVGQSYRVVPGTTRVLNADRDPPDTPIAPGTVARVSFYMPGSDLAQASLDAGLSYTFRVAIKRADKTDKAVIHDAPKGPVRDRCLSVKGARYRVDTHDCRLPFTSEAADRDRWLCYSTGIFSGGWCWFVKPTSDDTAAAQVTAKKLLGQEAAAAYIGRD